MFSVLSKFSMCTQLRFCVRVATRLIVDAGIKGWVQFSIFILEMPLTKQSLISQQRSTVCIHWNTNHLSKH